MPRILHIVNGDAFGNKLRASGIDGDILVWRESLYEGPIGMRMSDSALLPLRAAYMNQRHGIPEALFSATAKQQEEALDALSAETDEVVLWFEHDLYDQLMLCYLLSRLHDRANRPFQLSVLSLGEFPGIDIFYGLGQLSTDQIASLHRTWVPVEVGQLRLAHQVWTAVSAAEPYLLASLMEEDLSLLPFLIKALQANYDRYPSMYNGLNAIQQLILSRLKESDRPILPLFQQISDELSGYGLGDLQFWGILEDLRLCTEPLLQISEDRRLPQYGEALPLDFENWRVSITDLGILIHNGARDHLSINGVDDWIGGVRLLGRDQVWRRNTATTGLLKV
ncbi:hypothetical protein GCM10008018_50380 [Paenibacillus marchantiophytorum]|uniref:DUF1835 domain-containing protein n=1 Tax=Paenibacillus marchantiophytorum TaxID=1619310 RepID=A0ABQ1F2H9_9BACL|nr:DUF1835 domain-containing protein [Paenibacillus marchantiophytorum]GFZ98015.1 hypothetical protein GCM10008018_50380 [Paenibacillus marchantiophytorum]